MGSSGDILGQSMGLVRMIIREREWINWLELWILSRIIRQIGGSSCRLGTQRVSRVHTGLSLLWLQLKGFSVESCPLGPLTGRPTIHGPPAMPHVLSILRNTPRSFLPRLETQTLLSDVSTLLRPRSRRTIQHRLLRPLDTHDRLHDRYGTP